jgi:hypothetical protein
VEEPLVFSALLLLGIYQERKWHVSALQGSGVRRQGSEVRGQKSPGEVKTGLWINFVFYSPILIGCSTCLQPGAATSRSDARVVVKTFRLRC